jgi:hypothetical protein
MPRTRVTCPACNAAFDVSADKVGETVECPECFEPVRVEKSGGPKITVVFTHGTPAKKSKSKPKRRRDDDDDDDYEHDNREDEDYGAPPRRGYSGPSAVVPLLQGVGAMLTACIPPLSIILAIAAIRTGHPDRFPDPGSRWVAGLGRKLGRTTFAVYFLLIVVAYYALKHR